MTKYSTELSEVYVRNRGIAPYSDTLIVNIQRLMPVKGQKLPGLI